jgi:hypothetical protein
VARRGKRLERRGLDRHMRPGEKRPPALSVWRGFLPRHQATRASPLPRGAGRSGEIATSGMPFSLRAVGSSADHPHERTMPRSAALRSTPQTRLAPLRSALTVTAPLSVAGGGGRDEGRPG